MRGPSAKTVKWARSTLPLGIFLVAATLAVIGLLSLLHSSHSKATPGGAPSQPTSAVATPGPESATVTWTVGATGGAPTSYIITPALNGVLQPPVTFNSAATTEKVTGLSDGSPYTFNVTPVNASGNGKASYFTNPAVTPSTVPGAPTAVTGVSGNAAVTLTFAAPASTGGAAITGYVFTPIINGVAQTAQTISSIATTETLYNLTNGTTYSFSVAAINHNGNGAASLPSAAIVPSRAPAIPTSVVATPGPESVTLSWVAGFNGGAPITSYIIAVELNGVAQTPVTFTSPATTETVTGLVDGSSYTFSVTPVNVDGNGTPSYYTNPAVSPSTVPGPVTGVQVNVGDSQATVQWNAPANTGQSAITGYQVQVSTAGAVVQTDAFGLPLAETITGLTNGTPYTVQVAATNANGPGTPAPAPAPIKPAVSPPPMPTASVHVVGNQLVNANGTKIRLVGADRSGTEYMCLTSAIFNGPSNAASVQAMAAWGINVVRVPLNEDCWLGINGAPAAYSGQNYQSAIAAYVQLLNANGITAILDLHRDAPGTTLSTSTTDMPDADHAPAFWTSVATTFVADPDVIFDLYNEPNTVTWACWLNGCTEPGATWQTVGMQTLVNTVRATGATQPIMLGGLNYADDLSQWLANEPVDPDNQLIASLHEYSTDNCATPACWDQTIAPLAATVPIITGELGDSNDNCSAAFTTTYMNWADAEGISFLAWTWNIGDCNGTGFSLITNWTGTPTTYGLGLQNELTKLDGN